MTGSIGYKELHFDFLQDPKAAVGYLQECLADDDPQVFLLALNDVLAHYGLIESY